MTFFKIVGTHLRMFSNIITQNLLSPVTLEKIELPSGGDNSVAIVLNGVLTPEECDQLLRETEREGYKKVLISAGGGEEKKMVEKERSRKCEIISPELASGIWKRIKTFIREYYQGMKVLGINERMRVMCYKMGEYYAQHTDSSVKDSGKVSKFTVQLVLNEGFEGGATTFIGIYKDQVPVSTCKGSALVFEQDILHEGSAVISSEKYVLRMDIMYSADNSE